MGEIVDQAKLREAYKTGSAAGLSFLAASIVLFPSIFGVVKPPYVLAVALWIYVAALLLGAGLLAYAFYIAALTETGVPQRSGGLGLIATLVAAAFFALFTFGNLLEDQRAAPQVTALAVDKAVAGQGEAISFSADALIESGDLLTWRWRLRPPSMGARPARDLLLPTTLRAGVWRIPERAPPGLYRLTVTVSDGSRASAAAIDLQVKEKMHGHGE